VATDVPATEIELKLSVPSGALKRLGAHRLLRGRERPVTRRLYSVYFDTPALDLWRKGVALRVRREGGRWLQTVKGGGTVHAGLSRRAEHETEIRGPEPDFAGIGAGDLADALASPHVRAQLRPVFVTDFSRSRRILQLGPDTTVEAAIDSGEIKGGGRQETLSEVELELKQGTPWQLFEFALKLLKDVPLAVENRSKAERGFALARAERAAPVKARPAALGTDMTVDGAFKAVIWASLAHLQANERGMLEGTDPEYLHQMRVAVRRLRSAFVVFSPPFPAEMIQPMAADLKWLGYSLGPARDWDVFMEETLPPLHAEFGEHAALTAFSKQCATPHRAAAARARRAVRSRRYQHLVLTLAGWLTAERWSGEMDDAARTVLGEPIRNLAGTVLERVTTRCASAAASSRGSPPRSCTACASRSRSFATPPTFSQRSTKASARGRR
jgi:inorganic triphosphatase YgiF